MEYSIMGLETMMVMGAVGMASTVMNTNEQAEASAIQANKTMENMTTDILARLGGQKASFIGSGIALDADTGVYSVLNNTLTTGIEDLDLFRQNAEQEIDNIYSQGLMSVISQGITMGSMAGAGGAGGAGGFAGLGSLFGGSGAASTTATTTSATTGANTAAAGSTGGTTGFASLTNLFNFGG